MFVSAGNHLPRLLCCFPDLTLSLSARARQGLQHRLTSPSFVLDPSQARRLHVRPQAFPRCNLPNAGQHIYKLISPEPHWKAEWHIPKRVLTAS